MKKSMVTMLLLLIAGTAFSKMVKQKITVIAHGQDINTVLYKGSVEAAIMEDGVVILEHSDTITADHSDPERFLAMTGLDGLIMLENKTNNVLATFYLAGGKTETVISPVESGDPGFSLLSGRIGEKVLSLFPEVEQQVITKDKELKRQVSSLEYYRPTLGLGLILQYNNLESEINFSNQITIPNFSPGLMLSYDYRRFSSSLELQLFRGADSGLSLNFGALADLRAGVWLAQGFMNFNIGLQANYLDYSLEGASTNFTIPFARLYLHFRFRFTDRFMFSLTPGAIPVTGSADLSQSFYNFSFRWDFAVTDHLRIAADTIFYIQQKFTQEYTFRKNAVGINVVYQWNPGGEK